MRLISICPSNTELVAYLGITDQLIGVDDFSDWPKEVQELPKLGPDLSIDMDKVESLKPDLVLASLSVPGMEKNVEELKKRDIPYIVLDPNSLDEIAEDLLTVGKHTGMEEKAREVANDFKDTIQKYKTLADQIEEKPTLYWEWWPKPVFTPGGTNWLTEISQLAGAKNVFSERPKANVKADWEEVLSMEPDVICMVWVGVKEEKMNPDLVKKRPGWDALEAVQKSRIYTLEESLYCRPSPRLLLGLQKLAAILHPEVFPKVSY